MRIVFFGTSNVALPILEALHKSFQVTAVVTSPDAKVGRQQTLMESPVAILAQELQLPILKPDRVKGNIDFLNQLKEFKADVFIVVSYGKILPLEIINLPPLKTLNVHFSLLPKLRGPSPIQGALLAGQTHTGTTIFVIDEQVDHGPILSQEQAEIEPDDNFITLSQRLAHQSAQLLARILPEYEAGKIRPQSQNHEAATYVKTINKEDGKVDWNKSAAEIYNQFRAYYPWPGIWTTWNSQVLKILDCVVGDQKTSATPGTVLEQGLVATGDGSTLQIKKLQLAGKKEAAIRDFLNGRRDFVGSQLN